MNESPIERPPIGVPREYTSPDLPLLYPGEQAHAEGRLNADTGDVVIEIWLVEPMAGWRGRWLRFRWRYWGRWFADGPAQLEVSDVHVGEQPALKHDG